MKEAELKATTGDDQLLDFKKNPTSSVYFFPIAKCVYSFKAGPCIHAITHTYLH